MKALTVKGYLPDTQADVMSINAPVPSDTDVIVKIEAAAFNPLDAKLAMGVMQAFFPLAFPYIPGTDFAGTVIAKGKDVREFAIGDSVFGRAEPVAGGAIAEQICVDQSHIAHRPSGLDAQTATSLPTPAGVAQLALDKLACPQGAPLLITGTGAVARAAVILARDKNDVFVLGDGLDRLAGLGTTLVAPTDPELADIVAKTTHILDTTADHLQSAYLAHVKPQTHVASVAMPMAEDVAQQANIKSEFVFLQTDQGILQKLATIAATQPLAVPGSKTFVLDEAATVFDGYVNGTLKGKYILTNA
ncbi:NADP-dependent oxidoreductase [Thalassospira marina]|uniref:Enoyl reductase (ER) domain-containing protein n=1 Tax=Thalassospira marina TaxID=2048283 RepID=A0ABN5FVQ4_9PROT|nr:NADP-dependent oxidoreductase [Thalassospira marina]AUG55794.1 hypothetical protein CSC3H3_23435 [Thalassospira marina]